MPHFRTTDFLSLASRLLWVGSLVFMLVSPRVNAQGCNGVPTIEVDSRTEVYFSQTDVLNYLYLGPLSLKASLFLGAVSAVEGYQKGCTLTPDIWFVNITGDSESYNFKNAVSNSLGFAQDGVKLNGVAGLLVPDIQQSNCQPIQVLHHFGGSADVYAFNAGIHPYPKKISKAKYHICRNLQVENNSGEIIEARVSIGGGVLAAESFGNVDKTFGYAKLRTHGRIGLNGFDESAEIESTPGIFPEEASINVSRRINVLPGPVPLGITVDIFAESEAIAQAKSAGLYGLLSGAATAGVFFPDSIDIYNFTGQNGQPLPAGVRIYEPSTGHVFADTRRFPGAPNFLTTTTLRRDTPTGDILADVTVTNIGPGEARGVQLTGATLGATPTTTAAQTIGRLIPELPAGRATRTFRFPASSGVSGAQLLLKVRGNFNGGGFGGDVTVTIP